MLEKQLVFESIELSLNGDQWHSDFLAINPFGRIPVLIDEGFPVFESLAILDYLELQYPNPAFLPKNTKSLTIVRMMRLLAIHELIPAMLTIIHASDNRTDVQRANRQITVMLYSIEEHLVADNSYIAGDRITSADIVVGSLIIWLPHLNIDLSSYPQIETWLNRLTQRSAWIATQPNSEDIPNWLKRIQKLPKVRARQWRQKRAIKYFI